MSDENLTQSIRQKFQLTTTSELIRRMESAPDFGYDDEAYELSRRLAVNNKTWQWGEDNKVKVVPREQ